MSIDWISAEDLLQRDGERVMVVFDEGFIRTNYMYCDGEWTQEGEALDGGEYVCFSSTSVTPWMPYPAPPEGFAVHQSVFKGDFITGAAK